MKAKRKDFIGLLIRNHEAKDKCSEIFKVLKEQNTNQINNPLVSARQQGYWSV